MRSRKKEEEVDKRAGLCAYHVDNTWCPLPGSWSDAARGTQWYCWMHISERPQGHDAQEDLVSVIEDQSKLRAQRRAQTRTLDEAASKLVEQHPEWSRGEYESRTAYQERMIETLRKGLRQLNEAQTQATPQSWISSPGDGDVRPRD